MKRLTIDVLNLPYQAAKTKGIQQGVSMADMLRLLL